MGFQQLVKGEEYLRGSNEFKNKTAAAKAEGKTRVTIEDQKLSDIYGPGYKDKVFGKTREGIKANPTSTRETTARCSPARIASGYPVKKSPEISENAQVRLSRKLVHGGPISCISPTRNAVSRHHQSGLTLAQH